jgi:hypothetical protein
LRWLGHVERIPEERDIQKIYTWKLIASRPAGRPEDQVGGYCNERHPDNEDCQLEKVSTGQK